MAAMPPSSLDTRVPSGAAVTSAPHHTQPDAGPSSQSLDKSLPDASAVGSPMKKHRPSINFPEQDGQSSAMDVILANTGTGDKKGPTLPGVKTEEEEL